MNLQNLYIKKDNGKMQIIFLTSSPLHKMHFNDLYIDELSERFDTEIWDVSDLYGRGRDNKEFPQVKRIFTKGELEICISGIKQKTVVITNILIFDLYLVKPLFEKKKIPVVSIDKESIIFWMRDNFLKRNPQYASEADHKKFFWKSFFLTRKIYSYLEYRHMKYDYMFGAYNYFPEASKRFIKIHNLKYDEYLKSEQEDRVLDYEYILFMDAGLAHLPAVSGKPNSIDQNDYVKAMNYLFEELEKKYNLPVVIAAHPKSGYEEETFNGREIILYKTPELLKYAELVLAHYSTSLIDLVLQKKQVLFLYSEEYMDSCSRTILITTREYAKMLGAPLLDIKDFSLEKIEIKINEEMYDSFIQDHILNREFISSTNAQLIEDFLKKI